MSMAKIQRVREQVLRRGWQLTELYDDNRGVYIARFSGLIQDLNGEHRLWNLQSMLDAHELRRAAVPSHVIWVRHFESMIAQAEDYLEAAARKIAAGEPLHEEPRPVEASPDAERFVRNDQGPRHTGSGILDARGNPI